MPYTAGSNDNDLTWMDNYAVGGSMTLWWVYHWQKIHFFTMNNTAVTKNQPSAHQPILIACNLVRVVNLWAVMMYHQSQGHILDQQKIRMEMICLLCGRIFQNSPINYILFIPTMLCSSPTLEMVLVIVLSLTWSHGISMRTVKTNLWIQAHFQICCTSIQTIVLVTNTLDKIYQEIIYILINQLIWSLISWKAALWTVDCFKWEKEVVCCWNIELQNCRESGLVSSH